MKIHDTFYINGQWVAPNSTRVHEIYNPATNELCAITPLANDTDCINAIEAANRALPGWASTSTRERSDFINAAADEMEKTCR